MSCGQGNASQESPSLTRWRLTCSASHQFHRDFPGLAWNLWLFWWNWCQDFFWMETPSGFGKRVHVDSGFPWVTATEYPKHTFTLPTFRGWVNKRDPEDRIPGHHAWSAAYEERVLGLAVLFFYLAGGCALYCIFLHVCLKWRMTKAQEHFGGARAKRGKAKNWRSYATMEAECLEMCFYLIFSISWGQKVVFTSSNADCITESPVKLAKQCRCLGPLWRCWFSKYEGPVRLILEWSLLKIPLSLDLNKKLSSHPVSLSSHLWNSIVRPAVLAFPWMWLEAGGGVERRLDWDELVLGVGSDPNRHDPNILGFSSLWAH